MDEDGPGEIRHLWLVICGPFCADRRWPRNVVLRIYWDGATTPAVESPVGDFFAAGNGMLADVHSSLPIETASYGRAMNSYWRMPFHRHARVTVTNEGTAARVGVFFQIDWLRGAVPDDALLFHARYRQEYAPVPFTYYHFANITGSGTYVGTVLSSVNQLDSWFGEGNDRWFVDGELEPRIVGTGTEDYFNDGWNMRLQAGLRRGTTIMESPHSIAGARITAYRWHIEDPIPFTNSIVANIERRSFVAVDGELYPFLFRPDLYSSVAFFYHDGVFVPFIS